MTAAGIDRAYRGCLWAIVAQVVCLVGIVAAVVVDQLADDDSIDLRLAGIGLLVVTSLGLLAAIAIDIGFFLVLLYRCWDLLRDDDPAVSAGSAVGLLFIPVFSLYWIARVTVGLARDLNRVAAKRGLAARASEARMWWLCAMVWLSLVPGLGVALLIPQAMCRLWAMRSAKEAAKALAG